MNTNMAKNTKKWHKVYCVIVSSVFLLLLLCSIFRIHELLEFKVYDLFMGIKPEKAMPAPINFLIIDEEVKDEGLWPWKENWLAYLVNFLSGIGVKAVVIDPSLERFVPQIIRHPLIKTAETRTAILYPETDFSRSRGEDLIPDRDKRVRRFALCSLNGELLLSAVLKTSLVYLGAEQENLRLINNRAIEINLDGVKKIIIPLLDRGETLINYKKQNISGINRYTYFDIAFSAFLHSRQEIPPVNFDDFEGKVCFVGTRPAKPGYRHPTPVGTNWSALEIRANMLENIINKDFLRSLRNEENLIVFLISVILSFFIFSKLSTLKRLLSLIGLLIFYVVASFLAFSYLGVWADTFLPAVAILGVFSAITIYRYAAEKESRLEEHLRELARQLKKESLTRNSFTSDKIEVIIKSSSLKEAEGDFYDILEVDNNRIAVIMGKAPGKNLVTVNYIIKVLNEFRLQAPLHKRPRAVLNAVNNTLFSDAAGGMYATCLYLEIDTSCGILSFANAGHESLILTRQANPEMEVMEALNPTPLGIAKNAVFTDQTVQLNRGDLLVAFTGGVVEARNKNGAVFGNGRLKEGISQYRSWEISKLANKMFEKIHRFSEGQEGVNECSLLLLKIKADFRNSEAFTYEGRKEIVQSN